MINLVIEYKGKTAVVDLKSGLNDLTTQLHSMGISLSPDQIQLTDHEGDQIRVKLFGEDEVGSRLALLMTEAHTVEDAAMLDHTVSTADERAREELNHRIKAGQYSNPNELYGDLSSMLKNVWIYGAAQAAPVEEVFYFPLAGEIDEGEEGSPDYSSASDFEIWNHQKSIRYELEAEQESRGGNMAKYFQGSDSLRKKLVSAVWGVETLDGALYGKCEVKLVASLTETEKENLRRWVRSQNSDGLGEGFEQRPIETKEGPLYVSMWNSGDDYFVYDQEEMEEYLGQRQGPRMGGQA